MNKDITGNVDYGRALINEAADFKVPKSVIWEYVTNSFDNLDDDIKFADVKVLISTKERQIIIEDNASGMSRDMLQNQFFNLFGKNERRAKGGKPRGKYGTGKSACFGIGEDLEVITVKNGILNHVTLNRTEASNTASHFPVKNVEINQPTNKENGTKIIIKNIFKQIKLNDSPVVEKINNELQGNNSYEGHSVLVNFTECKPKPILFHSEFVHSPHTEELKKRFGDSKLYIRIANSSLDQSLRGIRITTNWHLRAKSLGGLDDKDQSEYIFGSVELPMLDDDKLIRPAFKSDRSQLLDLDSEDGILVNNWIGYCVDIERRKLIKQKDERRQSENARKLEKVAEKISKMLNEHLKNTVDQFKPILAKHPGTIDKIKNSGDGTGPLTDLILNNDGDIKASETNETASGHGNGKDVEPSNQDNELGKKLKKDESGLKNVSEKSNNKKPRNKGGFVVIFVNHGKEEVRAKYKNDSRTIEVNLDHPQLEKALKQVNNVVTDPNFVKLAYEVAIQEYVIALTTEMEAYEYIEDTVDDAVTEIQKMTDQLSRMMAEIYDSF